MPPTKTLCRVPAFELPPNVVELFSLSAFSSSSNSFSTSSSLGTCGVDGTVQGQLSKIGVAPALVLTELNVRPLEWNVSLVNSLPTPINSRNS
jgi:hypothetical protein